MAYEGEHICEILFVEKIFCFRVSGEIDIRALLDDWLNLKQPPIKVVCNDADRAINSSSIDLREQVISPI